MIEFVNRTRCRTTCSSTKEGALETVGLAAEAMVALPDAFAKSFVPTTPEVLFAIRLLNPGETVQARFTAPTQPGNYPFVCTFPGHWRTMNGIVDVRPAATPAQVIAAVSHDASRLPAASCMARRVPRRPARRPRRARRHARRTSCS